MQPIVNQHRTTPSTPTPCGLPEVLPPESLFPEPLLPEALLPEALGAQIPLIDPSLLLMRGEDTASPPVGPGARSLQEKVSAIVVPLPGCRGASERWIRATRKREFEMKRVSWNGAMPSHPPPAYAQKCVASGTTDRAPTGAGADCLHMAQTLL